MNAQQIRCPHCNQILAVPAGSVGQIIACPHCQGQLRMPAPAVAQPAARTPAASPPPRPPAPMAASAHTAARPTPAPARPPAPQINTGASAAAPMIHDPAQTSPTGRLMHRRKSNNSLVLYISIPIALLFVGGVIGVVAIITSKDSKTASADSQDKGNDAGSDAKQAKQELKRMYQNMVDSAAVPDEEEVREGVNAVFKKYGKEKTLQQMRDIAEHDENKWIRLAAMFTLEPFMSQKEHRDLANRVLDAEGRDRLYNPDAYNPE